MRAIEIKGTSVGKVIKSLSDVEYSTNVALSKEIMNYNCIGGGLYSSLDFLLKHNIIEKFNKNKYRLTDWFKCTYTYETITNKNKLIGETTVQKINLATFLNRMMIYKSYYRAIIYVSINDNVRSTKFRQKFGNKVFKNLIDNSIIRKNIISFKNVTLYIDPVYMKTNEYKMIMESLSL